MNANLPISDKRRIVIQRANEAGKKAIDFANKAVRFAYEAGQALCELKEMCTHGTFQKVVAEEIEYSLRSAQNYMKVYEQAEAGLVDLTKEVSISQALGDSRKAHAKTQPAAFLPPETSAPQQPDPQVAILEVVSTDGGNATVTFTFLGKTSVKNIRVEMDRLLEEWYTGPEFTYQKAPDGIPDGELEFLHAKYRKETLGALQQAFIAIYGDFVKNTLVSENTRMDALKAVA